MPKKGFLNLKKRNSIPEEGDEIHQLDPDPVKVEGAPSVEEEAFRAGMEVLVNMNKDGTEGIGVKFKKKKIVIKFADGDTITIYRKEEEEIDPPTYKEVMGMKTRDIEKLVELDSEMKKAWKKTTLETVEEARDWVVEYLDIEIPKKATAKPKKSAKAKPKGKKKSKSKSKSKKR